MKCSKCGREIYWVMDSSGTVGHWWTQAERDRDAKAMQKEWEKGKCSHEPDIPEPEHEHPPQTTQIHDSMTTLKPSLPLEPLKYPESIPPIPSPNPPRTVTLPKLPFNEHTHEMIKGMIEKGIATHWIEAVDIMAYFCHMATTHIMEINKDTKEGNKDEKPI